MITGLCLSLYGIANDFLNATWLGIVTISAVCVSWWCWVMFIIRHMISTSERADRNLKDIKDGLSELKSLIATDNFHQTR